MITYDNDTLLRAIMQHGGKTQILVAVEEMSELQKELLKNINRGEDNINHILEEMADVYITLRQLMMIYRFNIDDLNNVASEKQNRLRGRLYEEVR